MAKQQPNILFYMERCLIITNKKKQSASWEDFIIFLAMSTPDQHFLYVDGRFLTLLRVRHIENEIL